MQQIKTGALLLVNDYILRLICKIDSIYPFDLYSIDENGNVSNSGAAALLKFDILRSLENYKKLVYYNTYPLTLSFQIKFINVDCTVNAGNTLNIH